VQLINLKLTLTAEQTSIKHETSMSQETLFIAELLHVMELEAFLFTGNVFTYRHEHFKHHDTGHTCNVS